MVSNSTDETDAGVPRSDGAAEEQYPYTVVDRYGVEWSVQEVSTPQVWAKASRCLVLNSRECVRRVWQYPRHWRVLDAESLLRLGVLD